MKRPILPFLFAALAPAEVFDWGLRAGAPLNDVVSTASKGTLNFQTVAAKYTFGPTLEIFLPAGLAVTFDVLYRPVEYRRQAATGPAAFQSRHWEFPLMARYRLGKGRARPFIAGGPTFNHIGGAISQPVEFIKNSSNGIVFGGGLEVKVPVIRFSPEFRYTHWGSDNFKDAVNGLVKSNRSQWEFLVGVTF